MRAKRVRHALGIAIVLFWAAMMVLLARREQEARRPREAPPVDWQATAACSSGPGGKREEWLGVYLNGSKLGYAVNTTQPMAAGYRVAVRSHIILPVQGEMRAVDLDSSADIDSAHHLRTFDARMRSDLQDLHVQGKTEPGKLALTIETGGTKSTRTVPLSKPIVIPDAITQVLARQGKLRPNTLHKFEIFDPMSLAPGEATIAIKGMEKVAGVEKPVDALRAEIVYKGFHTTAWLTPEGDTLKEESSMGLTMVRQTREAAMQSAPISPSADLIMQVAIPTNIPIRHPRSTRLLRADLTGVDFENLTLATDNQKVENTETGQVEIRAEEPDPDQAPTLPVRAPGMAPYLAADAFVQSDAPAIKAAAKEAAGGETNSWKAAVAINKWVNHALKKSPTISVPSALDVLRTREGDCNEHTTLFVALARAQGIPAEICAGIVYVNDSFFYHAWPRVWVGRWVSMDPTFGQDVADATHIELVHGGLDRQAEIMRLVGRLHVRVISFEEKKR